MEPYKLVIFAYYVPRAKRRLLLFVWDEFFLPDLHMCTKVKYKQNAPVAVAKQVSVLVAGKQTRARNSKMLTSVGNHVYVDFLAVYEAYA